MADMPEHMIIVSNRYRIKNLRHLLKSQDANITLMSGANFLNVRIK